MLNFTINRKTKYMYMTRILTPFHSGEW